MNAESMGRVASAMALMAPTPAPTAGRETTALKGQPLVQGHNGICGQHHARPIPRKRIILDLGASDRALVFIPGRTPNRIAAVGPMLAVGTAYPISFGERW